MDRSCSPQTYCETLDVMSKPPRTPRLTDPREAAQHYRNAFEPGDLAQPTVMVVCCDDQGHPTTHLHLVGCEIETTPSECAEVLDVLLDRVALHEHPTYSGLSLGLTRPGGEQVQDYDRAWFRAFYRVCHRRGVVPHGVYVVGRRGARAVHIDDAA